MMNAHPTATTSVRQNLQAGRIEADGPRRSRDIGRDPAHPGTGDPGPADDRDERDVEQQRPADIAEDVAVKAQPQRLTGRGDIGDQPSQHEPAQRSLTWNEQDRQHVEMLLGRAWASGKPA